MARDYRGEKREDSGGVARHSVSRVGRSTDTRAGTGPWPIVGQGAGVAVVCMAFVLLLLCACLALVVLRMHA